MRERAEMWHSEILEGYRDESGEMTDGRIQSAFVAE